MAVCRNWNGRPGSCRFGDNCRFDHPEANQGFSNNNNRYAPLDNSSNRNGYQKDRNSSQGGGSNRVPNGSWKETLPYQLVEEQIRTDLTSELPQWTLSAYGPGRNAPEQLFGGPRTEQSFEEMRLAHYLGLRSGNAQQVAQEADKLKQETMQQIQFALNNMDGAIKYIIDAENKHPNRIDIVQSSMSRRNYENVFAEKENPNRVEFQPAVPSSNPFGHGPPPSQPAFGAPSQPGAFGQPSALGAKPNPFATPAQPAFGQPAFGAPSQPGGGAFGQPTALGQKPNPFSSQSSGAFSSFAQGGNAFGQPSQPAPNPFSQQPSQPSNPFAQPAQQAPPAQPAPANPFGAPSPAGRDPFARSAQPNPFTSVATSNPSNPFASATPAPNPFSSNPPNPFQNSGSATTNGSSYHPPLASYATTGPNGNLVTFKNQPVVYRDGQPGFTGVDGTWQKIWFPDGPPKLNKDTEMEDDMYDDETKAAYEHLRQAGTFKDGVIPMLPPKQEWCLWDF